MVVIALASRIRKYRTQKADSSVWWRHIFPVRKWKMTRHLWGSLPFYSSLVLGEESKYLTRRRGDVCLQFAETQVSVPSYILKPHLCSQRKAEDFFLWCSCRNYCNKGSSLLFHLCLVFLYNAKTRCLMGTENETLCLSTILQYPKPLL